MYKFIHFLLTAILTGLEVSISGIAAPFDPKPITYPYIFFGVIGLCILMNFVWGVRTKASKPAILFSSLISALPLLGPWIAFFVLVGYTPIYPLHQLLTFHKSSPVIIHMFGGI